jgi:hypothetical protein
MKTLAVLTMVTSAAAAAFRRLTSRPRAPLGVLALIGATSPASADAIYTYSGFPLQSVYGSTLAGQRLLFSFVTPTLLPANMSLGTGGTSSAGVAVPVISASPIRAAPHPPRRRPDHKSLQAEATTCRDPGSADCPGFTFMAVNGAA